MRRSLPQGREVREALDETVDVVIVKRSMDDLCDTLRLAHVAIGFVGGLPKRRWPLFLGTRRPPLKPACDLDELDDIFVWYLRRGYELDRSLYRLGLGPEPDWLPADDEEDVYQDEIEHACYQIACAVAPGADAAKALPATFALLVTAWLQAQPNRNLRLQVGVVETEVKTALAAEQLLQSQQGSWRRGDI